jgi:mannitol/fructose-specific phosphotransferase system IIA component (Ntr-type)/chromosome segregation and condensation protein ScpB
LGYQLNSRSLDILRLLLASAEPVSAAQLAAQLDITPRMVRSSLVPTEPWLANQGVVLKSVPGMGLWLAGSEDARAKLEQVIRDCQKPVLWLGPAERLHVLLLTLFFAERPLQIKQLQETLNVSRSTTLRVMDEAEEWLGKRRLTLQRRQNYGSQIVGAEEDWREAAIDLLHESAGEARLLARLQGLKTLVDASLPMKSGLDQALQWAWSQLNLFAVRAATCVPENDFSRVLSDRDYIDFFLRVALLIQRNRLGKPILAASHPLDTAPPEQGALVHRLAACIHDHFGILLSAGELSWLESRLPEATALPGAQQLAAAGRLEAESSAVRRVVDGVMADASMALHPSLSADIDLDLNLTARLEAMREDGQHRQELSAPLLQNIKAQYPYVYSTAQQSSHRVADYLGRIPDDNEVGEIAVCLIAAMERLRHTDRPTRRVLVVCSEGAVTAWLLVSRLRAEFPGVEVVEVISALELESRPSLDGIDFIVSTIPLKVKNIPTRQVNPLLGVADCRTLKELFEHRPDGNLLEPSAAAPIIHLGHLLTSSTIELGLTALTWQEVVDRAGGRMVQAGLIEQRFVEAMKDVIVQHGPYMVIWPGVVLLHAPPHGIRQLSMGLINLREPVPFGHPQNDPVRVAVVLAATGSRAHIPALLELSRLMQDEAARSAISSTIHKSVVLHWISAYSK